MEHLNYRKKKKVNKLRRLLQGLEESEMVILPTEKTKSFRITIEENAPIW